MRWMLLLIGMGIFPPACRPPAPELRLLKATLLQQYPSASSACFLDGHLYIIGDDAPGIIVLNSDHAIIDSLRVFDFPGKRISKEEKADLESSFIITQNGVTKLFAIGSLSTGNRDKVIELEIAAKGKLHLGSISQLSLHQEKAPMNIEGAAILGDNKIIFSNRANTTYLDNYFLITILGENGIQDSLLKVIPVVLPPSQKLIGISGLHFIKEKDVLLFCASEEDTPNAYTDGAIGESYIGRIDSISSKLEKGSAAVNQLIPLSGYLGQNTPQKIESITVEKDDAVLLIIHLVADNDDGTSSIYKMAWEF